MNALSPCDYRIVFIKLDEALREMGEAQMESLSETTSEVEQLMDIVSDIEEPHPQLLTTT